ncbi:hypothetical protein A9Z05_31275 [Burkholderia sp. A2]|nr:hypothetical protein A9Z05_31275 [Burkholderia sp. A2]
MESEGTPLPVMVRTAVAFITRLYAKVAGMRVIPKLLISVRRTEIMEASKVPRDTSFVPSDPPYEATIGTAKEEKVGWDYGICGAAHLYYDAQRQIIRRSDDQDVA